MYPAMTKYYLDNLLSASPGGSAVYGPGGGAVEDQTVVAYVLLTVSTPLLPRNIEQSPVVVNVFVAQTLAGKGEDVVL